MRLVLARFGRIVHRVEQRRHRLVQAQVEVALLGFATAATIQLAGAHRGQVMLIQGRLVVAIDNPWRAEQTGVAIDLRQIGKTAVEFELQFTLATAHAPPAIEQDASDHNDADDDQPFAQTEFHEIP
ncbi:hypothetical protein D3C72_1860980 [compost metagenome]